jgi:hypothetical protein
MTRTTTLRTLGVATLTVASLLTLSQAGTTAAAATSAVAAPSGPIALAINEQPVTSSTGHKLRLGIQAKRNRLGIQLSRSGANGAEIHAWVLDADRALTYHRDKGLGTLSAGLVSTKKFARVQLTLEQLDPWSKHACPGGTAWSAPVRATGTFVFHTHARGASPWGSVGSAKHPFEVAKRGQVVVEDGCEWDQTSVGTPPCFDELDWDDDPVFGTGLTFGTFTIGEVAGQRIGALPRDAGKRLDLVYADVPQPKFETSTDVLTGEVTSATVTVRTRNNAWASGSATLAGDGAGAADSPVTCRNPDGTKTTETTTTWDPATFTNGTAPLVLHTELGHELAARDSDSASFTRTVVAS